MTAQLPTRSRVTVNDPCYGPDPIPGRVLERIMNGDKLHAFRFGPDNDTLSTTIVRPNQVIEVLEVASDPEVFV